MAGMPPNTLFPSQTSVPEANASRHRLADQRGSLAMHCMVGTSRVPCARGVGCEAGWAAEAGRGRAGQAGSWLLPLGREKQLQP